MDAIHQQKDANKFLEGGIFYPTGHVVTAFANRHLAVRARKALEGAGFAGDDLMEVNPETMAREAAENLSTKGLLAVGASAPAREKQLELAEQGCHFLIVHAPGDEDHERLEKALAGMSVRYAVKYRRLIIENLVVGIRDSARDTDPARVP